MASSSRAAPAEASAPLRRVLGPRSVTALVVGGVIGSGIFILPGLMAAQAPAPLTVLLVFVAAGLVSLFGALTFAELGGMFPGHGGQYRYLQESLGTGPAFLYGWIMFWVVETGIIAAVSLAMGRFAGVIFGWDSGLATALAALLAIWALTLINWLGIRQGAFTQNLFTAAKLAAIALLVLLTFLLARPDHAPLAPLTPVGLGPLELVSILGLLGLTAIFAYDGWFNVTFVAAETRNPQRDVPIGLGVGMAIVTLVYAVTVLAYFWVLPADTAAAIGADGNSRIATAAARVTLGEGGALFIATAVILSTLGAVNAVILSGPRLYHALARDGLFWAPFTKIHPRFGTPGRALLFQAQWASFIVIVSVPARDAYLIIVNAVVVAIWLFNIVTAIGYFRLRRTRPDQPRPYRALGYPVVPALFLAAAVLIVGNAVWNDVQLFAEHGWSRATLNGLAAFWAILLTATGLPFLWAIRRRQARGPPATM